MPLHSSYRTDAVPGDATLTATVQAGHLCVTITAAPGYPNAVGWLVCPPGWPDAVVVMDMDGSDKGREEADQRLFPEFNRISPWETSDGLTATVRIRSHQEQVESAPSHREEYAH